MNDISSIIISGNTGEQCVSNILVQTGVRFYHNVYFENNKGDISQVDFIVILDRSLLCLEVKSFTRCIIKGNIYNKNWTVCYRSCNKSMYNPIMQNSTHINVIRDCLPYHNIEIYNYVVFANSCSVILDGELDKYTKVINMSSLWYEIIHLSNIGRRIRDRVLTDIIKSIDYYESKSVELSAKHCEKYYM